MKASNSWLCPFCSDSEGMPREFKSEEEYAKHMSGHTGEEAATKLPVSLEIPTEPKEIKKIELTYKYTGQCSCGAPVDTIELDVGDKVKEHFCIAWCPVCKKEQVQRKVVKL